MKKAILILMLLPFFASGQALWKVSADSSKFYNVGNTGNELIIENDTRTITNGVLTNIGNGRTIFKLPTGGSGDTANIYNSNGTIPASTDRVATIGTGSTVVFQTAAEASPNYEKIGVWKPTIYSGFVRSLGYHMQIDTNYEYFSNAYRTTNNAYHGNTFGGWFKNHGAEDQEWSLIAGATGGQMAGATVGENHQLQSWLQMELFDINDGVKIVPWGLHDGVDLYTFKGNNIFRIKDTSNNDMLIVTNDSRIKTPTISTDNSATELYAFDGSGYMVKRDISSLPSGDTNNIYRVDGYLTGNRNLDGSNKTLTFSNISAYTVGSGDLYFYRGGIGGSVKLAGSRGVSGSHSISNYVTRDTATGALIGAIGYTGVNGRYGGLYSNYSSSGAQIRFIESVPATSSYFYVGMNDTASGVKIVPLDGLGAIFTGTSVLNIFNSSNTSTFRVSTAGRISTPNMPVESCDTLLGYNSSGQQAKLLKSSITTDTSSLSTRINLKANIASPTFTGTVTIPTPFTLGATSVTSTGTQLNYLNAATGTTGTTSTNMVFSTSPTLTTPSLNAPAITGAMTGTGAYIPVSLLNSGTGATSSTYWRGDGTWASISSGGMAIHGVVTNSTAKRIPYFGTLNTLEQSVNMVYDSTNARLSIGGDTTPSQTITTGLTSQKYGIADTPVIYRPSATSIAFGNGFGSLSGADNTAVGMNAGIKATSGLRNTYVGSNAGNLLTSGSSNTAIGANCMSLYNNGGGLNTALGTYALYAIQGGAYSNVAIGYNTMGGGAIGANTAQNTCVGQEAGTGIQNVANNSFFGFQAGNNVTTGANNLSLGSQTGIATATASNQLSIQNAIYGTGNSGSFTTISPSATGAIGIYTKTPNSNLQVAGSLATGYVAKTGTYGIAYNDHTINCTANTFTVTLPTAVGADGRQYTIVNSGAGVITIATTSSQTFTNITATPTTLTLGAVGAGAIASYTVVSDGANWIVVSKVKNE